MSKEIVRSLYFLSTNREEFLLLSILGKSLAKEAPISVY